MKTLRNRMGRIRLFPLLFQNGCSQSSRFPTAGQGEQRLWERDWAKTKTVESRSCRSCRVTPRTWTTADHLFGFCRERFAFIKYLRQYAHSHWSIGVFRWEYGNTVATSRFLCFPGTIWNHFKAGNLNSQVQILSNSNEENFSKFWFWGLTISFPLTRVKKAKERRTTALCMPRC